MMTFRLTIGVVLCCMSYFEFVQAQDNSMACLMIGAALLADAIVIIVRRKAWKN